MPSPFDRRVNDNPSTYFVQDRKNKKDLTRLVIQDHIVTAAMGGVLPEQANPTIFRHVLDIGCGSGAWIIEAAQTYPTMSLVGIDISERMITYARTQAKAYQVDDRVTFHVMDALGMLEFPAASFDLANLRLGVSFMRTWDWPTVLIELLRVTRPDGIVRLTESNIVQQSNSPALTQLCQMLQCALFRAGHLFTNESTGLTDHLARLLDQYGCKQIQTKAYAIEYRPGMAEGQARYKDLMLAFQTGYPFIQKWGCASQDYEAIHQQALDEIRQPDFHSTWKMFTFWGSKPRPKPKSFQQ